MPNLGTIVRRIQRKIAVARIPKPLSSSLLNFRDDLKTKIRREPFMHLNAEKEMKDK